MIHKIFSNAWRIHDAFYLMLLQLLLGPNTRSEQDCRAAVRPAGNDDLFARKERLGAAIGCFGHNAGRTGLASLLVKNDLVHGGICLDRNIASVVLVGHKVCTCCPNALINSARDMATSLCDISGTKHVMVEWHSLRHKRIQKKL